MRPYGTRQSISHRTIYGKGGRRTYGALATGLGNRYCRAARKRARRMACEEVERARQEGGHSSDPSR
jgi:hypothetical protein